MKKYDREKIFNKYGGLCAYSGTPLESDWQVDHVVPIHWCHYIKKNPDDMQNLVPCQKIINHYKRALLIDRFRLSWLGGLHTRLGKLPKNPRTEKSKRHILYMMKVASYFGITKDKPFSGIFYFETFQQEVKIDNT